MKNIDDCFERGLLRKVEPSRTKSEQSLLQARDWLTEAEKNLQADAMRSAISSAYLAVFHSVRAAGVGLVNFGFNGAMTFHSWKVPYVLA